MPALVTFDLKDATKKQRNEVRCIFDRLGWQRLGGSAYRYPTLGAEAPVEDWFNHVIPALALFREFLLSSGIELTRYSLDVQSSAGLNPDAGFGTGPLAAKDVKLFPSKQSAFGKKKLVEWLDGHRYPY